MPVSCCAVNCANRFQKGSGIGFYVFPVDSERKQRWVRAISRDRWEPKLTDRLCGEHFVSGRPSKNPEDIDYVPTVFKDRKRRSGTLAVDEERQNRRAKRARLCEEQEHIEEAAESLIALSSSSCVAGMNQSPGQCVPTVSETAVQTDSIVLLPDEVDLKVVNQHLQQKVVELERTLLVVKPDRRWVSDITTNDGKIRFYTGLPSCAVFHSLLEYMHPKVEVHRKTELGRKMKLTYAWATLTKTRGHFKCGTSMASLPKLRPGFDPSRISEVVDTIEVPINDGAVSGLAASKYGLMAVLEEMQQKMFIYNQERTDVLEFSVNCPEVSYVNQITFDRHHNILIAHGGQSSLLRYNMNGKALPSLELPESIISPTGVACSPDGDLYVSSSDPYTIVKQEAGKSDWVTLYYGRIGDYAKNKFDPAGFFPGQMSFGSDGDLFVAADNCINVLAASDGKLKRQIGCDKYRDRELHRVKGICATGDGYLFVCDNDCYAHAFTADGDYLCKFGGNGDNPGQFLEPLAITVDWSGYLLISDVGNGRIQVY